MAANIPAFDIVIGAFSCVFTRLPQAFMVALIPMIVFFFVTMLGGIIGVLSGAYIISSLFQVIGYFVMGFFALAWIRVVLEGYKAKSKFDFGPRDQKFLGYYGLLLIPVFFLVLIDLLLANVDIAETIVSVILILGIVALYTMLQLVFPAAAVGEPTSLQKVWNESIPVYGPMIAVNMIIVVIFTVLILIVQYLLILLIKALAISAGMGTGGAVIVLILGSLILTPMFFIAMAVLSSAVALVYRRVVPGPLAT